MSTIGSSIEASILQAAQAQQSASKARDREKAVSDSTRRFADQVELKVAGVENPNAVRQLPHSESEESEQEQQANDHNIRQTPDDEAPRIDVTA